MKLALSTLVTAALAGVSQAATLYLVGDSTMANQAASSGIQGWGTQIGQYLTGITVVNAAISGRSARSYTREGRWYNIKQQLKAGDYVIIEFGHNDGGSPASSDRADVYGEGTDTQTVTLANGTVEVVQTFSTYLRRMVADALAKGATPILSSQTPNNPYENSNTIVWGPPRFVDYAKNVALAANVPYVDHFLATYEYYDKLGKATVDNYFPQDHTHTNTVGANSVAWAFLSGLKCTNAKGVLKSYVNSAGQGAGARC